MKEYDREYFERWYRGRFAAIGSAPTLKRKIATCVAMAEFVLDRPLQSILDIGCGEGRWQPVLYELRPDASYIGIDSSQLRRGPVRDRTKPPHGQVRAA